MGKYTKAWKARKPEYPIRPTPAFGTFVSNFAATSTQKLKGHDLIRGAAGAWRNLEQQEKDMYKDHDAFNLYKDELAHYKSVTTAMKAPPTSFGLFTKLYWQTKKPKHDGTPKNFGKIQKQIGKEWKKLSVDNRNVFKAGSKLLYALLEEEQSAVLNSKASFNLKWQNDGMNKIDPMLRKAIKGIANNASVNLEPAEPEGQEEREQDDIMGDIEADFNNF